MAYQNEDERPPVMLPTDDENDAANFGADDLAPEEDEMPDDSMNLDIPEDPEMGDDMGGGAITDSNKLAIIKAILGL